MTELCLGYVTAPSLDIAQSMAEVLVQEKLVACVNCVPSMRSVYRWEGKLEVADEVAMILKAPTAHQQRIIERVRQLHPYDTPCVLFLSIEAAAEAYAQWCVESCSE